jgi:hypothetical protein
MNKNFFQNAYDKMYGYTSITGEVGKSYIVPAPITRSQMGSSPIFNLTSTTKIGSLPVPKSENMGMSLPEFLKPIMTKNPINVPNPIFTPVPQGSNRNWSENNYNNYVEPTIQYYAQQPQMTSDIQKFNYLTPQSGFGGVPRGVEGQRGSSKGIREWTSTNLIKEIPTEFFSKKSSSPSEIKNKILGRPQFSNFNKRFNKGGLG